MVEIIGRVDHHGDATQLKHVGNGLIEVHAGNEFVGHVHLEQVVELADRSEDPETGRDGGGDDGV